MRTKTKAWVAACCLFLSGVAAQAGTLTSATWIGDFQGTPFTLVTSGASLTASGTSTASGIGAVSLTVAAPLLTLLDTTGTVPTFISRTLGGSQTLAGNVANQAVSGLVNSYIGTDAAGVFLFPVALSVGVGGNFTTTAVIPNMIPVEVTATFFPWTTGSQTITGLTLNGAAVPDMTFSGTNSLAGGVGTITLVSPTRTRVCLGAIFGTFPCLPGQFQATTSATATSLKLNFAVPEPGAALLLAAGLAALATRKRKL